MSFLSYGPVTISINGVPVGEDRTGNPVPLKRDRVLARIVDDYSATIALPISGVLYIAPPMKDGKPAEGGSV